jgi:SAM-dependent methyltransferase
MTLFVLFFIVAAYLFGEAVASVSSSKLEIFHKSWASYRAIISGDHMEHNSLTKSISEALYEWLESYPGRSSAGIDIADLGCGDLAVLGPLLKSVPLHRFCGVDMSVNALELAKEVFSSTECSNNYKMFEKFVKDVQQPSAEWVNIDMTEWAAPSSTINTDSLNHPFDKNGRYDVIFCIFSAHHLTDDSKIEFLRSILKNRMKPGGILIMGDVFRSGYEDLDSWKGRFTSNVMQNFTYLTDEQKEAVVKHVNDADLTASLDDFMNEIAPKSGWHAQLRWTDTMDLEKLLILKQSQI